MFHNVDFPFPLLFRFDFSHRKQKNTVKSGVAAAALKRLSFTVFCLCRREWVVLSHRHLEMHIDLSISLSLSIYVYCFLLLYIYVCIYIC